MNTATAVRSHTVTGFKVTLIRLPQIIVLTAVKSYGIERQIGNINSCFLKIAFKEQVYKKLLILQALAMILNAVGFS